MTGGTDKTGALKTNLLQPGTEVLQGRFRVMELLGRGGMGDVYLAEQISLGRKVALKTLREDLSLQPGMTERFKREALLLSQVDHPSVVRVIDFGQADASYVLVMEYVEGESLALTAREPIAVERAVRVLKDIAEGLETIHAKGIVHRDLKLDNVLLTRSGSSERARLLDFGIARFAESDAPGNSVTQAGLVLGTPEYISPEQATGGKVEPRADVYAFGILAYRLLSGRHPFEGPSAREFLLQHISQAPPPLQSFAPQVPAPLAQLVMACLEKDPAKRPDGGKGLVAALAALGPLAAVNTTPSPGALGFADTMIRPTPAAPVPPPVPTASLGPQGPGVAAAAPPVAAPAAPAPASPTPAAQAVQVAQAALQTTARKLPRWAPVLSVAVGALILIFSLMPRLTEDPAVAKAAALLDQGKPAPALEAIDASKNRNEGALRMLRAEAFHQLQRHDDEWSLVAGTPEDGLAQMRPALLAALLTDYPKNDESESLRAALAHLPKAQQKKLREWAKASWSAAQWGALRYADTEHLEGTDLAAGYLKVLESNDCEVLAIASRRLGELGEKAAIEPLKKVANAPRKSVLGGFITRSCGHDEARDALRKLGVPPEELPR